jgi:hypothetical protein
MALLGAAWSGGQPRPRHLARPWELRQWPSAPT